MHVRYDVGTKHRHHGTETAAANIALGIFVNSVESAQQRMSALRVA